ncbi:MAG: hemerythrin domain-containing protein [Gammaproteobacteria bacterium]|nr:hemerythrin domain-containing protein [Gammaproteobacteria bacterium]
MNTTATPEAPVTTGLEWAPGLQTGDARMDETHEEFVTLLNQLLATPQDQQLPLYREFVEHTAAHFAQEERWMLATGFTADNCHASHHATIMETLHAVIPHYQNDDPEIITRLAEALVEWFPQHAASMDAGLALHLKDVGFDSRTETLADPDRVRPATMSGCGSVSCS